MNQNQNLNSNLFLLFTTTIHDLNCFMRESTLVVRLWFSFYLLGPFFPETKAELEEAKHASTDVEVAKAKASDDSWKQYVPG